MDIKKAAVRDVFKIGKEDYSGLYTEFDKLLGNDNPFAQFKIGPGQYVWSYTKSDCEWLPMENASGLKEEQIRTVISELRNKVGTLIPAKYVDSLFTVPDDSFIFYNDDDGVRVLFTGWGFRKPKNVPIPSEKTSIKKHTLVGISFTYDGVRLKGYEFGIRLNRQVKKLRTTDDNGVFCFDNIKVGERYQLIDLKSDRTFDFEVEKGKTHYDFDITTYTTISVHADFDSAPLANEPMKIEYHGNVECPMTDINGNASLKVVYYEGENILVAMRQDRQNKVVEADNNVFTFAFEKPVEPEPSVEPEPTTITTNVKVVVRKSNRPVDNALVSVRYSRISEKGTTDINGVWNLSLDVQKGEVCHVDVEGCEPQERQLLPTEENVFTFNVPEAEEPMLPEEPDEPEPVDEPDPIDEPKKVNIQVSVCDNGEPVYGILSSVEYMGNRQEGGTDANGIWECSVEYGEDEVCRVEASGYAPQERKLKVEEDNIFIFNKEYEPEEELITLMAVDEHSAPMGGARITLRQQGKQDFTVVLDEQGKTEIEKSLFSVGETVEADLHWNNFDFSKISFTVDEDENEYLLQQQNTHKSGNAWSIIKQIMVVIAAVLVLLFVIWPLFESLSYSAYNAIYG